MKNKAFVLFSFLLFLNACSYLESETEQAERLGKTYQLNIKTDDPKQSYPKDFTEEEGSLVNVEVTITSLDSAAETLDGIESALGVYPEGFISEVIDTIYIVGAAAGGTYGSRWIALSNVAQWNGTKANYENAYRGIHHELSSLIFNNSPFSVMTWQSLLNRDWKAAASNFEALTKDELAPDYSAGFLSDYGKTSMGNDFNTYAEFAFAEPEKLRELAATYPIIAKKLSVFITAYTQFSAKYQQNFEEYFTRTGLSDVAVEPENVEMTIHLDVSSVKPKIIR
ncbi:hypothetical protein [Pseudoalteromonas sp. 1_2015MBL_MicDiv]|uniref:hypothetical protein n=1 Tax=Pseudoalteromonas sp. 1_2015MBL_MicDiv TaxID=1720343 RepID=UPI000BC06D56|nr:hypothetical protein [Pseudoalteromonas sp. 1_2015MBL_MicDiv]ATG78626.1 hypothetical protein AOR04_14405 [Pseudoalteromonas sp. 1_2015MBL_MicDiv]